GAMREGREARPLQQLTGARLEIGRGQPVQARGEAEILDHRQVAMQAERLRDVAELRLQLAHVSGEIDAENARLLGGELEQAGDGPEERRLPRAIGADDADELRSGEREIDAGEGAAGAESLLEPAEEDALLVARGRARIAGRRAVAPRRRRVARRRDATRLVPLVAADRVAHGRASPAAAAAGPEWTVRSSPAPVPDRVASSRTT